MPDVIIQKKCLKPTYTSTNTDGHIIKPINSTMFGFAAFIFNTFFDF